MERLKANITAFFIVCLIFSPLLFLMATCEGADPTDRIEAEFNITTATIIVHWFDSEKELQLATQYNDIAGVSECEWRPDFNISFCELWLVRPNSLQDDYDFDTIGHEIYHTLAGEFHD